jgi:hypothetical protein
MLTKGDIDWLKSEFIPSVTDSVKKALESKLTIDTKLDKFIGEIQKSRDEQELHTNTHDRLDLRVTRLEKHAKLLPLSD